MFNRTDINNQQLPLNKLKDLINEWKSMEENAVFESERKRNY